MERRKPSLPPAGAEAGSGRIVSRGRTEATEPGIVRDHPKAQWVVRWLEAKPRPKTVDPEVAHGLDPRKAWRETLSSKPCPMPERGAATRAPHSITVAVNSQ